MAGVVTTVIPATVNRISPIETRLTKKKVAAYARVSTDNDEQLSSFDAQIDYYTRHIKSNAAWEFVGVYTDEGISATSTKKREGFKRMIADALDGKIDLILTKSVSRFARNTVDTLTTVRDLKDKGVEVYFEKENIYTLDSKGELLISIISSISQEESRSISSNVTWGIRKRFADGKVSLPYKQFLGYEKGEDGAPKIVESEAKIIRLIYKLFLEGDTPTKIAKHLTEENVPTPSGKKSWHESTIRSILQNEKYKGDALLQKSYTTDFLTKKTKKNDGELAQYYVQGSHQGIVTAEVYELVQEEFKRRKAAGKHTSAINCFASRITCVECGGFYGRKVWHSNTKYATTIWQCNNKFQKRKFCSTPHLKEEIIKKAFVEAFNSLIENKDDILQSYEEIIEKISDFSKQEKECSEIDRQCEVIENQLQRLIAQNARSAMDQREYDERYNGFVFEYNSFEKRRNELSTEIAKIKGRKNLMEAFMKELGDRKGLLEEFDEGLWSATLNTAVIKSDREIIFKLKDGTEIPWELNQEKI